MTVTVKAIDPALPSLTVAHPTVRTITRRSEDRRTSRHRARDLIDVTYTRALLTSVERGK